MTSSYTGLGDRQVALRDVLATAGHVTMQVHDAVRAASDPWGFATRLWGAPVHMAEAQPIRPVPHGRSFASTDRETPLHTDSQSHLDAPPNLQIMVCEHSAREGGETVLVDGWALLDRIGRDDPALFADLFDVPRCIPFVFGDVLGPTVSLRGGALVITHSPMPLPADPIARRLQPRIDAAPRIVVKPAAGEVLVVDNHRMLHGRRAFTDPARSFLRVLAWVAPTVEGPAELVQRARRSAAELRRRLPGASEATLRTLGLAEAAEPASARLALVVEMLRGRPPGVLAGRAKIPEPELYRLRNAAVRAAVRALEDPALDEARRAARGALDRLRR